MQYRHSVLFGIGLALFFLILSTFFYPGGSVHDPNAPGFYWQYNYFCNLFDAKAVNGQDNAARPWALTGMFFLCLAVAVFFIRFSPKIPQKSAAAVVRYAGAGSMVIAVFTATPYHDPVVTASGTLLLLSLFYITVFVLRSRLQALKVLSVVCMLVFYATNFVYYTSTHLEILPVLQKVCMGLVVCWMLALDYFTALEDFQPAISSDDFQSSDE